MKSINLRWDKIVLCVIIALAIGFGVGYICHTQAVIETTVTKVDTLVIEKPIPYRVEVVRKVSVPVYVPTPADTVVVTRVDSILVKVPVSVESKEYRDSTYRAIVSGPAIGGLSPSLDKIEVYQKHTTTIVEKKPPLISPYLTGSAGSSIISVGGGAFIKAHHGIGAEYINVEGKHKWALRYTYKF